MNRERFISAMFIRIQYLVITIAIILSIVARVKIEGGDETTGIKLQRAAGVLYLIVFIVICGLVVLTLINMRYIHFGENRLVYAINICLSITAARILYSLISAFEHSSAFNVFEPNIWTEAFMQVLEEMLVAVVLIAVGLVTKTRKMQAQAEFEAQRNYAGPQKV